MQDLRSLIERCNAEDEKRVIEDFRFMEQQKIKKSLGPRLWEELNKAFVEHCEEISKSSSHNLIAENEGIYFLSVIDRKTGREAVLKYDPDVPCVHYHTPAQKGEFTFRVSSDGNSLDFLVEGISRSIGDIVAITISQIIVEFR